MALCEEKRPNQYSYYVEELRVIWHHYMASLILSFLISSLWLVVSCCSWFSPDIICLVRCRGLHGSKNSYPKRPVNMLHGTDPDPYFIWKWDPNPCRPEKCHKCSLLPGPDTDPTIIQKLDPNPAGKTQTRLYPSRSAHIAQHMLLSQWTSCEKKQPFCLNYC